MAFDFPNAPTMGQTYQGYTWDGEKWVGTTIAPSNINPLPDGVAAPGTSVKYAREDHVHPALPIAAPQCGYLSFVNATGLKFAPKYGNRIRINGVDYAIPAAGIAGLSNTGVFVNSVAGQNLAANGSYNISVFSNAGVLTADFVNNKGHFPSATPGNDGVEILTGDDSRSFIGFTQLDASASFVDIRTLSWFNRRGKVARVLANASGLSTGNAIVQLTSSNINFATWPDEVVNVAYNGTSHNNTLSNNNYDTFLLDGAVVPTGGGYNTVITSPGVGYALPLHHAASYLLGEGAHSIAVGVGNSGGSSDFECENMVAIRG